ncbi:hypothetical protein LSTR_LSTR013744 [Laodelphax striatellus]|uniref:Uncharacterized protein n=1 Tax=Laodelphax striatellus TaxID=195883 RepID=A0A482WYR6_LAOST|nr:hypothetical protein LSTR_LSTR013744 [Laodelphax striatellus]
MESLLQVFGMRCASGPEQSCRRDTRTFRRRLIGSQRCSIYPELARFTDYVHEQGDYAGKVFLKARTELILLNKYVFGRAVQLCSLCNMKEDEDVPHFVEDVRSC